MLSYYEDKIRQHIDRLFADAPNTQQVNDIKEEMLLNTIDRFNDAKAATNNDEQAYITAISGIGDVSELIKSFSSQNGNSAQQQRYDQQPNCTQQQGYTQQPNYARQQGYTQQPNYAQQQGCQPTQPKKSNTGKTVAIVVGIIAALVLLLTIIGCVTGAVILKNLGGTLSGIFHSENISTPIPALKIGDGNDEGFDSVYNSNGAYTVPSDGINTIVVDWVIGEVEVNPYAGSDITFSEEPIKSTLIKEEYALRYKVSGGSLNIRFCKNQSISGFFADNLDDSLSKKLVLNIPQSLLNDNALVLKLNGVSNKTAVNNLSLKSLGVDSVSGDITLIGISTTGDAIIGNVSGNVMLDSFTCDEFEYSGISGDVGGTINANKIRIDSVSGNVDATVAYYAQKINVDTISGDVALATAADCGYELDFSTVSGDIIMPNGKGKGDTHYTHLNGGLMITIGTVSGDARITHHNHE